MQSMMHPQAEWISTATRRSSATTATHHPRHHDQQCQRQHDDRDDDSAVAQEVSNPHRGSGGLVRGRAVFCLPPTAGWFQGHFAYAARGGCTASLGVLGTELPVDAVCLIQMVPLCLCTKEGRIRLSPFTQCESHVSASVKSFSMNVCCGDVAISIVEGFSAITKFKPREDGRAVGYLLVH